MAKLYDVIIAGAGPVGLFLACELSLSLTRSAAAPSILVLERSATPEAEWWAMPLGRRGLTTSTMETLHRRGLLDKFVDMGARPHSFEKKKKEEEPGFQFGGHFAGIMLNAARVGMERWRYRLPGPSFLPGPTCMDKFHSVLTERAESMGVEIRRGTAFRGIAAQDHRSITVEAGRDGETIRGRWLVGCDGGRSQVRKSAGISFEGTEAKVTGYAVECDIENGDKLKPGFQPTSNGMYIQAPGCLYLVDFDGGAFDRDQEITAQHVQDVLDRVSGMTEAKVVNLKRALAFTDRAKQVPTYRKGRVLVAGDAAHIHPPLGGQGLNLGIGDAMNLGWKLAATVRHEADDGESSDSGIGNGSVRQPDLTLLDTYHTERHAIGLSLLEWTRAQVVLLQPDAHGQAVQQLIRSVINTDDGTALFIDRSQGLTQRYPPSGYNNDDKARPHPLVGCSAPDFVFGDGARLGGKMEGGQGLLVDFGGDAALRELVQQKPYGDRVEYVGMGAEETCGVRALLVRPDGVVAWAVEEKEGEGEDSMDVEGAKAALERWFKP